MTLSQYMVSMTKQVGVMSTLSCIFYGFNYFVIIHKRGHSLTVHWFSHPLPFQMIERASVKASWPPHWKDSEGKDLLADV